MALSCSKKKLSALLRRLTSKTSKWHNDFCCKNCLHSFATEDKCESHKKVCESGFLKKVFET